MKFEIDEELWYGVSSDEQAEAQAAQSMAARMGRIVGAKPFPAAAQRLSQLTQDPSCLMDDVVSVLESDPALSARLLRLVNSVGFSLRTACTSVRHAAALVGTEKLNQVASTAAILDMYESGSERAAELLEHATVVGTLCRYLGFHFGLPPDELFTCGFLHDIGKLMLLDTEGEEYLELLGEGPPQFDTTFVAERERFGFDHALLAGHVLAAWNIPHPVPKVVAWHHHVTRAYAESTEISQMVSTLRLADAMSYALRQSDTTAQIEMVARMEAASYMDISEGQLAAMWEEVRALTERARAVFRGEKVPEADFTHTSRPSGASMRAVARARHQDRVGPASIAPVLSERPRQFPCVVCNAPSYAHKCVACHGYMCPLHVNGEDDWCELCQKSYEKAGIPQIRPVVSTLFGALCGGLLAAAFFGAASAGAQRPLRLMLGPTLILMLLGMLVGVGQRWIRRWWFLRTRPDRASFIPATVEAVLDSAAKQSPQILEIVTPSEPSPPTERIDRVARAPEVLRVPDAVRAPEVTRAAQAEPVQPTERGPRLEPEPPAPLSPREDELRLRNPVIPQAPGVPDVDASMLSTARRERHWMSSMAYKTPTPPSGEAVDQRATSGAPPRPVSPSAPAQAVDSPTLQLPSIKPRSPFQPAVSARPAEPPVPARPAPPPARPAPRPSSAPPTRVSAAAPVLDTPRAEPVALSTQPTAVSAPDAAAPPQSSVVSINEEQPVHSADAAPSSGWSSVLDSHGTASGW